jgi:hypothetical protein
VLTPHLVDNAPLVSEVVFQIAGGHPASTRIVLEALARRPGSDFRHILEWDVPA